MNSPSKFADLLCKTHKQNLCEMIKQTEISSLSALFESKVEENRWRMHDSLKFSNGGPNFFRHGGKRIIIQQPSRMLNFIIQRRARIQSRSASYFRDTLSGSHRSILILPRTNIFTSRWLFPPIFFFFSSFLSLSLLLGCRDLVYFHRARF